MGNFPQVKEIFASYAWLNRLFLQSKLLYALIGELFSLCYKTIGWAMQTYLCCQLDNHFINFKVDLDNNYSHYFHCMFCLVMPINV